MATNHPQDPEDEKIRKLLKEELEKMAYLGIVKHLIRPEGPYGNLFDFFNFLSDNALLQIKYNELEFEPMEENQYFLSFRLNLS
jgi:hypothetical protein